MENELKKEIEVLKAEIAEYKKKVDDLYSVAGFPEQVLQSLQSRGFFRVQETLPTTFPTVDGYDITYYYQFGNLGGKDVVFSNLDKNTFTQITDMNTSTNVFTAVGHGLGDGNPVTFRSTQTAPTGLINGGTYYIADSTADTFKLSSSGSGTPIISISNIGAGRHFLQKIIVTF